jgi:signal transduction histidine kinase
MTSPAAAFPHRPTFGRMWAWSFAVWTLVSALFALQSYVWYQSRGEAIPAGKMISTFTDWQLWAILTPFLLCFVWRHPVTRATWRTGLRWQVLGAIVLPALVLLPVHASRYLLSHALAVPDLFVPFTPGRFFSTFVNAVLTYLDIVLVGHAIHYARTSRQEGLHRARLEARLAEAQLQVLRLQLHPHFLFNTLHTVSALMHKDLRAADRMLALLGDLLRDSFEKVGAQEVSLQQELAFLDRYLEIERTRFRDRLTVDLRIDPEALDAEVPNLLLQPLVENAIRHGIGRRQEAGRIEIEAERRCDRLEIRIRDNGPGLPEGPETALRTGVGLANTAARLEQLYPASHRFELRNRAEGGLEVALEIPFRPKTAPAAPSAVPLPLATAPAALKTQAAR